MRPAVRPAAPRVGRVPLPWPGPALPSTNRRNLLHSFNDKTGPCPAEIKQQERAEKGIRRVAAAPRATTMIATFEQFFAAPGTSLFPPFSFLSKFFRVSDLLFADGGGGLPRGPRPGLHAQPPVLGLQLRGRRSPRSPPSRSRASSASSLASTPGAASSQPQPPAGPTLGSSLAHLR